MRRAGAVVSLVVALGVASEAGAWEAETTHAGLAERSALASELGEWLADRFDLELGLFESLVIPPGDAPALFEAAARLNPTHGYAPSEAGELSALGWLVAGAVLADMPASHAIHHAYDPLTQSGFSGDDVDGLGHRFRARAAGGALRTSGMPATEWLTHPDNPFGLDDFLDQYALAVSSRTPAARRRHAAGMLLAAGGIVHVVQDIASPARARDDRAAMLQQIGPDPADVGSRFERLASLSFGRLGVPAPSRDIPRLRALVDYISNADGSGLADRASRGFMSRYTVPKPIEATQDIRPEILERRLGGSLRRPSPAPSMPLDLRGAASEGGARLVGERGICLAHYRLRDRELSWSIPDRCALEQASALLGEASAYGAGVLDWLFRGDIAVRAQGDRIAVAAGSTGVEAATLTLLWEDERGVRTAYGEVASVSGAAGASLARVQPPAERGARRIIVLLRGTDEHGEAIVASGWMSL